MNLTKLDRANKLYAKLKELDEQVKPFEKYAQEIAQLDNLVDIKFSIPLPSKEESFEEKEKREYSSFFYLFSHQSKKEEVSTNDLLKQVTPPAALRILGIIMEDMYSRRKMILNELEKLGINI